MIVKIVLGESLKSLIGELKLSYRRIWQRCGVLNDEAEDLPKGICFVNDKKLVKK